MWREKIIEAKDKLHKSTKDLAEEAGVSEKTVYRILTGKTKCVHLDDVLTLGASVNLSPRELFEETSSFICEENITYLQKENEQLKAEIAELRGIVASITAENVTLKVEASHKDEIIALHNYYNKLKSND